MAIGATGGANKLSKSVDFSFSVAVRKAQSVLVSLAILP